MRLIFSDLRIIAAEVIRDELLTMEVFSQSRGIRLESFLASKEVGS